MKTLVAAAVLLLSPASAAVTQRNYLRQTRGETRLGRPSGFTWITTSSTEAVDADVEIVTLPTASEELTNVEIATLPTDASPAANTFSTLPTQMAWTPTCTASIECYPKLRVEVPSNIITEPAGVSICDCYATSISNPFDECQGDNNGCAIASCFRNSCDGRVAVCEEGICVLDLLEVEDSVDLVSDEEMPAWCENDFDCGNGGVCIDESGGMCFAPPCGRCVATLEIVEVDNSMSMLEVSIDENEFEFLEESLSCGSHADCIEVNGCCSNDGTCHSKTEATQICWSI